MKFKKYIYYSTIGCIFTEALRYNIGFDLKFFYLIVILNTFFLALFDKLKYSRGLLIFHSFILISGVISCVFGYNLWGYFLGQLFFLLLIPTYFFSFFKFFQDQLEDVIKCFCKFCFYIAIIGIVKLPYDLANGEAFHSIMLEPAHYCTIVLPAFFITLKDKTYPRYYFLVIFSSIIITGSSLGYLGLALSILFFINKISIRKIAIPAILVIVLAFIVYSSFAPLRIRINDTVSAIETRDVTNANLSTYAWLSNLYVSIESFKTSPLLGNGIGSHIISRTIYLPRIEGIEVFEKMNMDHLNAQDAASLFFRIMSEIGLVGLILTFLFIGRGYVPNNSAYSIPSYTIVSRAILLYFFCKLFREGHYFSPEMYFFVMLYVFNRYRYLASRKN